MGILWSPLVAGFIACTRWAWRDAGAVYVPDACRACFDAFSERGAGAVERAVRVFDARKMGAFPGQSSALWCGSSGRGATLARGGL